MRRPVLAGISNHGRTGHQPYVTAGDRTYLIGTQDGNFPDMGQHVPGEMGGLWLPPIKLIDGFQARITDAGTGKETLLSKTREMIAYPYDSLLRYGTVLPDLDVDRFQFSPDHEQGLIVQYRFKNASTLARKLHFEWSVKTDLRPGWDPDRTGIRDGQDVVDWSRDRGVFIARDTDNPWYCVWSRIDMEWLVRDVPGVGGGLSGGFMEYPWWFGTETYSLQALTATGDFALATQTLRLLRDHSREANGNGRIAHEIASEGQVTNPGNTQETAQFIMAVGKVYEWTGDRNFAREMYPEVTRAIDWLMGTMDPNKDLFPEGYGIMEVLGLNSEVIDVAVYTQQALEAAAHIAEVMHDEDREKEYRKLAAELKQRINRRFWIARDGTYGDIYGSRSQAVSAVDGAIKQMELEGTDRLSPRDRELIAHYERVKAQYAAMPEGDRAWLINDNWVTATPMETGIAPRPRAVRLLDRIRQDNTGDYGPYLSAVERRSMMTISTGVEAVAEGRYGRIDQALWYMDKIAQTFNRVTPGSMSEMMPDRGCFTIAWTSYGIVLPLIEDVFGIRPRAEDKTIVLEPHLPAGWEDISIEDLPVGTNLISFSRSRIGTRVVYDIDAKENGWSFILKPGASPNARYLLNDNPVQPSPAGIRMRGTKDRVLIISR